jgi:hypothetical protein
MLGFALKSERRAPNSAALGCRACRKMAMFADHGARGDRGAKAGQRKVCGQKGDPKKVLTRGGIRPQPAGNWLTRPPKRIRPRLPMAINRYPALTGKVYRTRNPKGNLGRQKTEFRSRKPKSDVSLDEFMTSLGIYLNSYCGDCK